MRHYLRAVAAITVIALAGCGSAAPGHATTPAPVARPTTASPPADTASQVHAWFEGPGGQAFSAVVTRLEKFGASGRAGRIAAARRDCARLGRAVTTAQAAPPVPDAASQRFWALALTHLESAAADCQAGAGSGDASMVNEADAAIVIAGNDLAQMTVRLDAIRRQG
jgi:hypothetical protein